MVIDLTTESVLKDKPPQVALKATQTPTQRRDVFFTALRQKGIHHEEKLIALKSSLPLRKPSPKCTAGNSISSRNSSISLKIDSGRLGRKRRLENLLESPSGAFLLSSLPEHHGLSNHFCVDDVKKTASGMYPKAKAVKRESVKLHRGSQEFQHLSLATQSNLVLQELYGEKLASIKGPPVAFTSVQNTRKIDFNFEFIERYKIHEDVQQVDSNFNAGCYCLGKTCNLENCSCLSFALGKEQVVIPYKMGKNGVVVLHEDFMKRTLMIYECSFLCNCASSCMNRVVDRGRTVRLEIFQTENRGFGLKSPDPIQFGQYIDSYCGEVVTKSTVARREKAFPNGGASYFFDLDFWDNDEAYIVDGKKFGSITRFMNHSCKPNCKMFSVSHNHADDSVFGMAFFALYDLPPGTELTFDYDPSWEQDIQGGMHEVNPEATKCLCGEKTCRRVLWTYQRG
ncbi:hypothetical protein LOZ57_000194 [Ophidiomyces ophidiicola]|uniref:uncharacterized protein n=1 Tax=Ophidiomyces ophidiicola TaxID=1387563 RepID=UPI0020C4AB5C|nr:uncharacterized protein LOZ57_000194 [Ophidiomyces ophidiicola]KAI1953853.1 hypothetical protein LOZ57_000194 [Ophidiomyces ophidiicola]